MLLQPAQVYGICWNTSSYAGYFQDCQPQTTGWHQISRLSVNGKAASNSRWATWDHAMKELVWTEVVLINHHWFISNVKCYIIDVTIRPMTLYARTCHHSPDCCIQKTPHSQKTCISRDVSDTWLVDNRTHPLSVA